MMTTRRAKNKLNAGFFCLSFFSLKVQFQFAYHLILKLPDRKLMNKRHLDPTWKKTAEGIKFYAKINLE